MRKNQRYSKDQMYSLIRKWESSGISQIKFIEEHQISKSTFGYWRKKYLQNCSISEQSSKMIPVNILPPKTEQQVTSFEIVYPNGVRIVCPAEMEASRVKDLIF